MKPYVLIVDDDEGIAEVARIILSDSGYEVKSLTNSENIFDVIAQKRPAVILLDLWMPELSGEDILIKMKRDKSLSDIPVVVVSASKDTEKVAKNLGADDFLTKPFDINELEAKVAQFVNN